MRRILIIFAIGGIFNMAVIANTIKGFMPGRIDKQNVTQEPGSFGTYTERERVFNTKNGPKTVYDTNFYRIINGRSFDIEKASEMPIRPTIKLSTEQLIDSAMNPMYDDRSRLMIKTGPKSSRISNINLPQR